MAKYRKVETRIWNDAKFRTLSDNGKLCFFFLLTHPHMTSLGAMRMTLAGMSEELGWPSERLSKAFREAFGKGLVKHDPEACFVWLPNFLKYNKPESPNVVKSWGAAVDLLPECGLKDQLIKQVEAFTEALPEAFSKALPEAFRKAMPNQEQEPEPEQEPDTEECDTPKKSGGRAFVPPSVADVTAYCRERGNHVDAQRFVDFYQSKGWVVGKSRMKDWKAAVRTWEGGEGGRRGGGRQPPDKMAGAAEFLAGAGSGQQRIGDGNAG